MLIERETDRPSEPIMPSPERVYSDYIVPYATARALPTADELALGFRTVSDSTRVRALGFCLALAIVAADHAAAARVRYSRDGETATMDELVNLLTAIRGAFFAHRALIREASDENRDAATDAADEMRGALEALAACWGLGQ